jgi:hypothetical protein
MDKIIGFLIGLILWFKGCFKFLKHPLN